MTALRIASDTIPAFPLGRPIDGRKRYGMTPSQARIYRWLVANRSHTDTFMVAFRVASADIGINLSCIHSCVVELVARGWIAEVHQHGRGVYRFVEPVMMFKDPGSRT